MEHDYTIIETAWGDNDAAIHIKRDSKEFVEAAQALSDFMNMLSLPADKHNRLVNLTVAQVGAAEESAFKQGFGLGLDYGRYEAAEESMKKTQDPHIVTTVEKWYRIR